MKDEDIRFDHTCHVQSGLCRHGVAPRTAGADDHLCGRVQV